ncbi:hypothetical protein PsorP6_007509 [Peronosclerospora sorghi]|uniref:Uncharacterized protein n=1 Tax=Peronosclerospora sorghi TaxID=230839 RepID=A0ACC0WBR2_9STRA|nr:hypothetical protein PsorP6_007509 [Peronosclerospora sorghi]
MASTSKSRANVLSKRPVLRSVQVTYGAESFGQEDTECRTNAVNTAVLTDDKIVIDRIMRKKLENISKRKSMAVNEFWELFTNAVNAHQVASRTTAFANIASSQLGTTTKRYRCKRIWKKSFRSLH